MPENQKAFPHYFKEVPTNHIDVYRVAQAFNVIDPCAQHALKKILCCGQRGSKDEEKDIKEAIASLQRMLEMRQEEADYAQSVALTKKVEKLTKRKSS